MIFNIQQSALVHGKFFHYGKHPQVESWLAWHSTVVYNSPLLLANRYERQNGALEPKMSNRSARAPMGMCSPEHESCQRQTGPKCPSLMTTESHSPRAKPNNSKETQLSGGRKYCWEYQVKKEPILAKGLRPIENTKR